MLDRIEEAEDEGDRVALRSIVEHVGRGSFGPLLLMAGITLSSPLSGIPGIPTSMGVLVLLISAQLLIGRKYFWLPGWLLNRTVTRARLNKALGWLRPVARLTDRCVRPRLTVFAEGPSIYIMALICAIIAAGIPIMETVPFSATGAGVALAVFGLALIARDGLWALIAFTVAVATFVLTAAYLLGP